MGNYSLSGLVGVEMRHKVVGVVGTGAIGQQAARILKVRTRGVVGAGRSKGKGDSCGYCSRVAITAQRFARSAGLGG